MHTKRINFIQTVVFKLAMTAVLITEATTMRNEIRAVVQVGFTKIHIEGDNKILIQVVQGRIQASWEVQVFVQDILSYFQSCNHVIISHIFRQGNRTTG